MLAVSGVAFGLPLNSDGASRPLGIHRLGGIRDRGREGEGEEEEEEEEA